jgi:hypothetical protein
LYDASIIFKAHRLVVELITFGRQVVGLICQLTKHLLPMTISASERRITISIKQTDAFLKNQNKKLSRTIYLLTNNQETA